MKIHHVGYLTGKLLSSIKDFNSLGYIEEDVIADSIQQCNICLLHHKKNGNCIELVEPFEGNAQMQKLLKKRGAGPYHICFEVEDIQSIYDDYSQRVGWLIIFKPINAVA